MTYPRILTNGELLEAVDDELNRAEQKFSPIRNSHEAYGVIAEEVAEFFELVRANKNQHSDQAMRKELIQIAAMAVRTIKDLAL